MAEFDPNDPRKSSYLWATFQPYRSTKFKMHLSRGPALASCGAEHFYILYTWSTQESRWAEVCRVEGRNQQTICHACGRDVPRVVAGTWRGLPLRWWWVGRPFLREVGLCKVCADYTGPLYKMMNAPIDKRSLIPHPAVCPS